MNIMSFLRMFKRKIDVPPMPPQQVDAMNSLMGPRRTGPEIDTIGALDQFNDKPMPKQNMALSQQELDELLYGRFTPPVTAAENARLMEMKTPTGVYDE
jgi:hypothetical protein